MGIGYAEFSGGARNLMLRGPQTVVDREASRGEIISYPLGARNSCPPAEVILDCPPADTSAGGQSFLVPKGQEIKTRPSHKALIHDVFIVLISPGQPNVGFYSKTCPDAEKIINSVVKEATLSNPKIPPVLLRLHFDDCFVEGCDGFILIDEVPDLERGIDGHQGVEGFGEIKRAKDQLERDGRISSSILVDDMLEVDDPIDTLKSKFRRNGL
ncbi:Peroxidase [Forsythia ovata]|uniref:peroxidase n=1 Tax=Forsythia ovata TaxID=205694 RepID=A0ABD1U4N7_9LAMI